MSKYSTYDEMFRNLEATVKYAWKGDAPTKHRVLRDFANQYDPNRLKLSKESERILNYLYSTRLTTSIPQSRRTVAVGIGISDVDLFNKSQQELVRNKLVNLVLLDEVYYLEIKRKGVEYIKQYVDAKNT